jgi:thermitase
MDLAIKSAAHEGRGSLGIPIFWAVANDPGPISHDPVCSHPDVIAVGRSRRDGLNDLSASGPELAFVAPGTDVFSTGTGNQFRVRSGTSFATPLAAGVAALVLSLKPNWSAQRVGDLLRESCDPIGGLLGHHNQFGFGRLNAATAVAKAKAAVD